MLREQNPFRPDRGRRPDERLGWWLIVHVVLALPLFPTSPSAAQEGTLSATRSVPRLAVDLSDARDEPLGFRRIYAPDNRYDAWPWGTERYRPVDAAQMEQILKALEATKGPSHGVPGLAIPVAVYSARWEDGSLVDGRASILVRQESATGSRLLLDACNLALQEAHWADRDGETAHLGTNPDGQVELQVPQAGRLEFRWSLRGTPDGTGGASFEIGLPPALCSALRLDLPEGYTPLLTGGILVGSETLETGLVRWSIDLGGLHQCHLRVTGPTGNARAAVRPRLRQSIVYTCSMRAMQVVSLLTLDPYDRTARRVVLWLDPGLQPLEATYDGRPIGFAASTPADGQSPRRLEFLLPEYVTGARRELSITALVPVVLDRPWHLPRIRLDEEDIFWQETQAVLTVERPLVLQELTGDALRAVATTTASTPRASESVTIQYFAPDARPCVRLAASRPIIRCDSGTVTHLRYGEAVVQTTAVFRASDGYVFLLEGILAPQWMVDSVTVFPDDPGVSWEIEQRGDGHRALNVRLTSALGPSRSIRLVVRGHRSSLPYPTSLSAADLIPIRFGMSSDERHLLILEEPDDYQLWLSGADAAAALDPSSWPDDLAPLTGLHAGTLFLDAMELKDLTASLRELKTDFTCRIESTLCVAANMLRQSHRIRCSPLGGRLERVTVQLNDPPSTPPLWTLADEAETPLTARRLDDGGEAATSVSRRERWEILLPSPRAEPFELQMTCDIPLDRPIAATLPSLPEAKAATGEIRIVTEAESNVRIESRGLRSLPLASRLQGNAHIARAAFLWDPMRQPTAEEDIVLVLGPLEADPPVASAWIWDGRLESRYESTGQARHRLFYWIENRGASQMRVTLPSPLRIADVQGVWVDSRRASWQADPHETSATIVLPLPSTKEYPVVIVQFTEQRGAFSAWTELVAPRCVPSLPQLQGQWIVWLPPDFSAAPTENLLSPGGGFLRPWKLRLLQPLRYGASQAVFDPLDVQAWGSPFRLHPNEGVIQERAVQWLQRIARTCQEYRTAPESQRLDWGTLLAAVPLAGDEEGQAGPRVPIFIDQDALDRAGITPRAFAPRAEGWAEAGTASHGRAILEEAGLTLRVHNDVLVITTEIAASRTGLGDTGLRSDTWRPNTSDASLPPRTASTGATTSLIPAPLWASQRADIAVPWFTTTELFHEPAANRGWTAHELSLNESGATRITVVHLHTLESARWIVFLCISGLALYRLLSYWALCLLAFVMAMLALFVPTAFLPIVSGSIAGAVCGLGFRFIAIQQPRLRRVVRIRRRELSGSTIRGTSSGGSHSGSTSASDVGLLILACLFTSSAVANAADSVPSPPPPATRTDSHTPVISPSDLPRGQEIAAATPQESRALGSLFEETSQPYYHPIFIPVDDKLNRTGDYYFVSERFFRLLMARVQHLGARPAQWQLRSAWYRGRLSRAAPGEPAQLERLSAVLEFEVFQSPAQVRVALESALPTGVTLDGQPVLPRWQDSDGTLVFDIDRKGPCRLEVLLRPRVQSSHTQSVFSIQVPPVADARLTFDVPADLAFADVPNSRGRVSRETASGVLRAELGAIGRLDVRWAEDPARGVTGPAIECEELYWLKIRAGGAAVLQTRFRYHVTDGSVKELRLSIDPHLRHSGPIACDVADVVSVENTLGPTLSDQAETFRVTLSKPVTDHVVLRGDFVVTGFAGVGRLRVPLAHSADGRVTRRRLAVSMDDNFLPPETGGLTPVAVSAFLSAWGSEPETPLFAVELENEAISWSVLVQPQPMRIQAGQSLDLVVGSKEATARYTASLTASDAVLQHHVTVPPTMHIDRVRVTNAAEEIELLNRWTRIDPETVVLTLSEATAAEHRLFIDGRIELLPGQAMELPVIRLADAFRQTYELRLYRRHDILLDVTALSQSLTAEEQLPPTADVGDGGSGEQLLATYQVADPLRLVHPVMVTPNNHLVRAKQLTILRQEDAGWATEVRFEIDVQKGLLDELRLHLPAMLAESTVVLDKALTVVAPVKRPDDLLVLRPRNPIEGVFRFTLAASCVTPPGEPVRVPHVRLDEADQLDHTVVLPRQAKNLLSLEWQVHGAQPTDVPDVITLASRDAYEAYRVLSRSFNVFLQPHRATDEAYAVDVRFAWSEHGGLVGIAVFDLGPSHLRECLLALPAGFELLHVTVGGVSVIPTDVGDGRWRVALGSTSLPRRIETIVRSTVQPPRQRQQLNLSLPHIERVTREAIPVRKTFWAVASPSGFQADASGEMSRTAYELERFRALNELMVTAETSRGDDQEELAAWYELWCKRWVTAQRRVRYLATRYDKGVETDLDTIELRQRDCAQNLSLAARFDAMRQADISTDLPTQLWEKTRFGAGPVLRSMVDGAVSDVRIVYSPVVFDPIGSRLAWAGIFVAMTVCLFVAMGRGWTETFFRRWPHLTLVALGLVWWLWFWPSFLGFLLLLIGVASTLWPGWRWGRPSPSTVRKIHLSE